jgi:branched-chain amino acid transport system ATP-binding protein
MSGVQPTTGRLSVEGVTAGYGSVTVLRDVHLTVPPGSVVALLGPNGAGKTTLLRVIAGQLPARRGTVNLDGQDISGWSTAARAASGVCLVPEGRGVFRRLTVRENLCLQARPGGEGEAIARATEVFPVLGARLTQTAGTLSGGEQQMLALARSYVSSPRIVLLDEVSMGLAPKIVDEIFDFLAQLAATGVSLLLVEQYVSRALAVADYAYLMAKGSVVFAGEPTELEGLDVFSRYLGDDAAVG